MKLRPNDNTVKALRLFVHLLKHPEPRKLDEIADSIRMNPPAVERHLHAMIQENLAIRLVDGRYALAPASYDLLVPYLAWQNQRIEHAKNEITEATQLIQNVNHLLGEVG